MMDVIEFYGVSCEYGWLSNFAPHSIRVKGRTWKTVEHYFQAQKFAGTDQEAAIRKAKSPAIAARLGRDRSKRLRRDWESIKVSIMHSALKAKFEQHEDLREHLLATGDAKLVEHTARDAYWGDGGDGSGKNMLGLILMKVREELNGK